MMFRKLALAGLVTALAGATGSLHAQSRPAEETLVPGYWKYETRAALGLLNDTDYKCVRPEDRRKFLEPCNRHNTCTYTVSEVADGRMRYEGVWVEKDDGDRSQVRATGAYTDKRFVLNATIRAAGIPIPISGTITATWQSATCPAGAKRV